MNPFLRFPLACCTSTPYSMAPPGDWRFWLGSFGALSWSWRCLCFFGAVCFFLGLVQYFFIGGLGLLLLLLCSGFLMCVFWSTLAGGVEKSALMLGCVCHYWLSMCSLYWWLPGFALKNTFGKDFVPRSSFDRAFCRGRLLLEACGLRFVVSKIFCRQDLGLEMFFPSKFALHNVVRAFLLQAVVTWRVGSFRYLFGLPFTPTSCVDFFLIEKSENALRVPRR